MKIGTILLSQIRCFIYRITPYHGYSVTSLKHLFDNDNALFDNALLV